MLVLERLCLRFPLVASQLRARPDGRPALQVEDEHDLQDLLQALLALEHDDIRPQVWAPPEAGGRTQKDFLLKLDRIVVVARYARPGLGPDQLAQWVQADIQQYRRHPDCQTLVCFVYDPERCLAHPREVERALNSEQDGFTVRVFIAPKA